MDLPKKMMRTRAFWASLAAILIVLAVLAFPHAYRLYGNMLVSRGVSTDFRKGEPCTPESKNPCVMPDGTEVRVP